MIGIIRGVATTPFFNAIKPTTKTVQVCEQRELSKCAIYAVEKLTCEFSNKNTAHKYLDEICPNFAPTVGGCRVYVYKLMFISQHHLFMSTEQKGYKNVPWRVKLLSFKTFNLRKGSKMLG
jgi:hypothetical protein